MDVSEILSELNDHGFTDTGTTRKVSMIQQTIWDIEGREPWPFLEKVTTLNFDGSAAAPTNYPVDVRTVLWIKDTETGTSLNYLRYEEFEKTVGKQYTLSGAPKYFYFEGDTLKVWPVPVSSTARFRLQYIRWSDEVTDATLEAAIEIPKQYHALIVWGTLWKLYDMEDDPELAVRYQEHYESGLQTMRSSLWQRQLQRQDTIEITDSGEWNDCW